MTPLYPQLVISNNVPALMQEYRDAGCAVVRPEEVHDVASYRGSRVVVVGDLARTPGSVPLLLKVLERATCAVVCVSSRDEYDATFLSRFASVRKDVSVIPNTHASSLSVDEFLCDEQRDLSALVRTGPSHLPLAVMFLASRLPAKRKLFA